MSERPPLEELRRAAAPGRVRELAVALFLSARLDPRQAGAVLSGAQRELRSLRSRQRRWVLDALYDLVRHEAMLTDFVGTTDGDALWVGWLARCGLDPDEASELSGIPVDFSSCARWEAASAERVEGLDPADRLALLGGFDRALADEILARFPGDEADAFLAASNARAPVTLRANRARISRTELAVRLATEGVPTRVGRWAPDALLLEDRANLSGTRAFQQGLFEVQDEGSQLLAALVDPRGLVVDLCAGAGGKSLALAASGADRVVATDVRERALQQLQKRANRAGAGVEVHQMGARGELPKAVARLRADRVLVDAPCTGTGVLRRHPEHRWWVDRDAIADLVRLQREILDRAAELVKPGGRLIYGTCSVLPSENRAQIATFFARHPDFRLVAARSVLGKEHGDYLETAPHTHDTDGFFGAVLERE